MERSDTTLLIAKVMQYQGGPTTIEDAVVKEVTVAEAAEAAEVEEAMEADSLASVTNAQVGPQ